MNNSPHNPAATAIEQTNGFASEQFDNLVAEVVELIETGEDVAVDKVTADCPHLREQLKQLLPTLQAMASLGHSQQTQTPSGRTVDWSGWGSWKVQWEYPEDVAVRGSDVGDQLEVNLGNHPRFVL